MNVTTTNTVTSQLNDVNSQIETQQNKTDYLGLGSTLLGAFSGFGTLAYGARTISDSAALMSKKLLGEFPYNSPESIIVNRPESIMVGHLWKGVSINAGLALGLFTLSSAALFGPTLLKRIQETKNQPIGKEEQSEIEQKTAELDPEEKVEITKLISSFAKANFTLSVLGSTLGHFAQGTFDYTYAGYSYLFKNCTTTLDITRVLEKGVEKLVTEQFEVCQSSMVSGKVHLLAGAILLGAIAAPFLAMKAKELLTTKEEQQ